MTSALRNNWINDRTHEGRSCILYHVILGIGIDALDFQRFQYYTRTIPNFLVRAFSNAELTLSINQLAGNFSAKEAFFKSCPKEVLEKVLTVEILRDTFGKPFPVLRDLDGNQIKSINAYVSLTNLDNLIVSTFILSD